MIYLMLEGRIGNQLFQYAMAENLRLNRNKNEKIIIDDSEVCRLNWVNSLKDYHLYKIEYVHDRKFVKKNYPVQFALIRGVTLLTDKESYIKKYKTEQFLNGIFKLAGVFECENGFMDCQLGEKKNIFLRGFFQSEKYFAKYSDQIKKELSLDNELFNLNYPGIDEIKNRNSVCISIKVQHNVGNGPYDVCNNGYWQKAIKYITENVDNPLFFICSDNVDYVKENLIDTSKYDVICQSKDFPVSISLAAMSKCKHFIIGNTTFGWWAQYLSVNPNKIVIAPSRWMNVDMPIDIYQDSWILIEV